MPFRTLLVVPVGTRLRRGARPGTTGVQDEGSGDDPPGLDPARLRGPLPAGFIRGRPPDQQDAGHAVVRRVGEPEVVRECARLGRGPDDDDGPPAWIGSARSLFSNTWPRTRPADDARA